MKDQPNLSYLKILLTDNSFKNLVAHQVWHNSLVDNSLFTYPAFVCLCVVFVRRNQILISVLYSFLRSPDLTSSRDDDDSGYNSTKVDEVLTFSYYKIQHSFSHSWISFHKLGKVLLQHLRFVTCRL